MSRLNSNRFNESRLNASRLLKSSDVTVASPQITSPGSLDVSNYKIGTEHTITAGMAIATGGGSINYEYRWLVNSTPVATTAAYTPQAGDDELNIIAQWRAVESGGDNDGAATGWQSVGSGTVTYPAPVSDDITEEPSFSASQVEPGDTITLDLGACTNTTPEIEYFTINGLDATGDLDGLDYIPSIEGEMALKVRYPNSGGAVSSIEYTARSNVRPTYATTGLSEANRNATGTLSEGGLLYLWWTQNATEDPLDVIANGEEFEVDAGGTQCVTDTSGNNGAGWYLHGVAVDVDLGISDRNTIGPYPFDNAPPSFVSGSPADDEEGVLEDDPLILTMSEPLDPDAGGEFYLYQDSDTTPVLVETFDVATGLGDNGGSIAVTDDDVTIIPGDLMAASTVHSVLWELGAVLDLVGLPIAANASHTFYNFTTAAGESTTYPTFIAAGSVVQAGAASVSPAWPTHSAGNVGFLIQGTSANGDVTVPTGDGFTGRGHTQGAGATNAIADFRVSSKTAASGAESNPTCVAGDVAWQMAVIATFADLVEGSLNKISEVGGTGASITLPDGSTTGDDAYLLIVVHVLDAAVTVNLPVNSNLTEITSRINVNGTVGGPTSDYRTRLFEAKKALTGAMGTTAITLSGSSGYAAAILEGFAP